MVDKVDTTPFEEPSQQDKPKEAMGLGSGVVVDSKHGLVVLSPTRTWLTTQNSLWFA